MKTLWKPLSFLLVHPLPSARRADAPPAPAKPAPAHTQPVPPMLRWRAVIRASLNG